MGCIGRECETVGTVNRSSGTREVCAENGYRKTVGTVKAVYVVLAVAVIHLLKWLVIILSAGEAGNNAFFKGRDWHTRTDGRTDTHTDAGNNNTWRPKLASSENYINLTYRTKLECCMFSDSVKCVVEWRAVLISYQYPIPEKISYLSL